MMARHNSDGVRTYYLIAQNEDSRKRVIALAKTYFAVLSRKQEISEKEYNMLTEDEKWFYQKDLTSKKQPTKIGFVSCFLLFSFTSCFIFYKNKFSTNN